MNFNKILLLLQVTTYSIILIATTYATTTEAARQRQAEVNLSQQQQQQVAPPRPLKYGDKTTIKIPLKVETTPTPRNRNNGSSTAPRERQQQTRNRPQSRTERITPLPHHQKPQLTRRYDTGGGGSSKNQLIVQQHDIPIVHKNRELFNKPITPTVGQQDEPQQQQIQQHSQQQQRRPENLNRSRLSNVIVPIQQPTQQFPTNDQSPTTIARTATTTTHNSRQRKPAATTTRSIASTINNHQPPTSSSSSSSRNLYNSNHNHENNSSIVSHQQQRGIVGNNNSQPLLNVAAAASAAAGGGRQSTTASSSNKQRSNLNVNQSVRSASRSNTRKSSASTALTTTTSSTTTTTSRPPFQLPNFNIFTPEFWQFLIPTTSPAPITTTRKPPKKYKPAAPISNKEEKLIYSKPKTTTLQPRQPEPIVNNIPKRDDGPFRIALPTFNILSQRRDTGDESEKGKRDVEDENLRNRFNCPRESEVRFQLFPKICKIDEDCKVWNRDEICCEIFGAKSCVSGIPKPLEETSHSPILGVIPRKCPDRPLAELWWEVKECETDMDCWPRVCCPDGRRRYCRTSQPELNTVPVPVKRSFNYLTEYLECTAPPPPIFDLHPKVCTSTLDCFPNVCCQEAGLRHCRPPKKSVLTMLANVFNVDFVKRLTQNIVIK